MADQSLSPVSSIVNFSFLELAIPNCIEIKALWKNEIVDY